TRSATGRLRGRPPAVDGNDGAGDVAGDVGSEVKTGLRDVVHVAGAPDGDAMLEQMTTELRHSHPDGGVDGAGSDHVDAELVLDQLHRGGAGELVETALGGDVGREVGRGHRAQGGADVDDAAAAALAHEGRHRLGQHEGPDQVDAQHLREVGGADL